MRVTKMIAAATLPAMIASPVAAANPAASLSLRGDSGEAAKTADESTVAAAQAEAVPAAGAGISSSALLIGGLAVIAVVIGAVAMGSGHHNSHPASA
jgi:hypothetical protein